MRCFAIQSSSRITALCSATALLAAACGDTIFEPVDVEPLDRLQGFEAQLDSIRVELQIPGMAAAIAEGDQVVWARGFGLADVESGRPATDTTSFVIVDLHTIVYICEVIPILT